MPLWEEFGVGSSILTAAYAYQRRYDPKRYAVLSASAGYFFFSSRCSHRMLISELHKAGGGESYESSSKAIVRCMQ